MSFRKVIIFTLSFLSKLMNRGVHPEHAYLNLNLTTGTVITLATILAHPGKDIYEILYVKFYVLFLSLMKNSCTLNIHSKI